MSSDSPSPSQRARAVLLAAEAAAAAAGAAAGGGGAAAPPAQVGAERDRLLALADELADQAAEARRRLDELEAALARLDEAPR